MKRIRLTRTDLLPLARCIKHLRKQRGFSQLAFANKINMSGTHYGRIECAQADVTYSTLKKIAHGMSLSTSKLIDLCEQEENSNGESLKETHNADTHSEKISHLATDDE